MKYPARDAELAQLFCELFNDEELQWFLCTYHREIDNTLPPGLSLQMLASGAAGALDRHGKVDANFFAQLRELRPRRASRIDAVARAWDGSLDAGPVKTARRVLPYAFIAALVAGLCGLGYSRWQSGTMHDAEDCRVRGVGSAACGSAPSASGMASDAVAVAPAPAQKWGCPPSMSLISPRTPILAVVSSFCLDRTEITHAEYSSSLSNGDSSQRQGEVLRCRAKAMVLQSPDCPVNCISPDDARAFCERRGHRLPSLGEWVLAAAQELSGRDVLTLLAAMNVGGLEHPKQARGEGRFTHRDAHPGPAPVGSYREKFASPQGLDDMFGNIREIVQDNDRFLACGSGWSHLTVDALPPDTCLDERNAPLKPEHLGETIGFRCAGKPIAVP